MRDHPLGKEGDLPVIPLDRNPWRLAPEKSTPARFLLVIVQPEKSDPGPARHPATKDQPVGNVGAVEAVRPLVRMPVKIAPERFLPERLTFFNVALVRFAPGPMR